MPFTCKDLVTDIMHFFSQKVELFVALGGCRDFSPCHNNGQSPLLCVKMLFSEKEFGLGKVLVYLIPDFQRNFQVYFLLQFVQHP